MDVRGLRALICVLVVAGCVLTLVPFVSAAVVADAGAGSGAIQEAPAESGQLANADDVHIEVFVHENGSATFTVDYRFENVSDDDWERLRDDVENNSAAYAAAEHADWNETLRDGHNQTNREMDISNVSVATDTSSAPRDLGHVEFTFRWSSFAHVELNRVEVGDAFAGFTLVDDTTLQLFWPDTYTVREVDPSPDTPPDGSVLWNGDDTEFADDQPWLVLIENGDSTSEPTDSDDEPAMPWLVVTTTLAVLATLGVTGWWLRRADSGDREPTVASDHPAPTANGNGGANDARSGPPPDLLSNEERVLRLLEQRGGRVKQQEIVAQLDWTEAKTSQVVGSLREADDIEVFRIGRENVIALPDDE